MYLNSMNYDPNKNPKGFYQNNYNQQGFYNDRLAIMPNDNQYLQYQSTPFYSPSYKQKLHSNPTEFELNNFGYPNNYSSSILNKQYNSYNSSPSQNINFNSNLPYINGDQMLGSNRSLNFPNGDYRSMPRAQKIDNPNKWKYVKSPPRDYMTSFNAGSIERPMVTLPYLYQSESKTQSFLPILPYKASLIPREGERLEDLKHPEKKKSKHKKKKKHKSDEGEDHQNMLEQEVEN